MRERRGLEGWRARGPEGSREANERGLEDERAGGHEAGRQPATGSGTITLRVLKPDPMPVRTSGDAGPYLGRVA
jgi:hypothetical protein